MSVKRLNKDNYRYIFHERQVKQAETLQRKGYGIATIAHIMRLSYSQVRSLLMKP